MVAPLLTIITPLDPRRRAFFAETRASVDLLRSLAQEQHWALQWILSIDGDGVVDDGNLLGPDDVIRSHRRQGPAGARTVALSVATGSWIFPLDADDELNPSGLAETVMFAENESLGWIGGSRTLLDGSATAHTVTESRRLDAGQLSQNWTSPLVFHPNSCLFRRSLLLASGGWPALETNEDLAAVLLASELQGGAIVNHIVTRYRTWEGQMVADGSYRGTKAQAFHVIAELVNARRGLLGREPVPAPVPSPAQREALQ